MLHTKSAFFDSESKAQAWARQNAPQNATVDIYETLLQAVMHIDAADPDADEPCWVATATWETEDKPHMNRYADDSLVTVAEAAKYKQVSVITIRAILRDDARRDEIFPHAKQLRGKGRPEWRVSLDDLDLWRPIYGRGKR